MTEEKAVKKGRSVALSGAIGFVLAALLVGMLIGGAVSLFVIGPILYRDNADQGNSGNQNTNYQNGNNNQGPTNYPFSNNQNNYNNQVPTTSSPNNNNQNGNYANNNDTQNNNGDQGMGNNNPSITNPTGQYSASGKLFEVSIPDQNGGLSSGTISADVNCAVQQSGNNIQLDLTITPTSIPLSLNQAIGSNSTVTFNFAGTTSGSQISAQASGTTGPNSSQTFNLNLSGSIGSNTLTITVTSTSNSQISISTLQPITLQSS